MFVSYELHRTRGPGRWMSRLSKVDRTDERATEVEGKEGIWTCRETVKSSCICREHALRKGEGGDMKVACSTANEEGERVVVGAWGG